MSKERIDPDKMTNELAGASSFFKRPTTVGAPAPSTPDASPVPSPLTPPVRATETPAAPPAAPATHPQPVRPGRDGRPARRIMIRHPFEIYADQLEGLRERSDQVRRTGENGSMSKMVRDAIDQLLERDGTSSTGEPI